MMLGKNSIDKTDVAKSGKSEKEEKAKGGIFVFPLSCGWTLGQKYVRQLADPALISP